MTIILSSSGISFFLHIRVSGSPDDPAELRSESEMYARRVQNGRDQMHVLLSAFVQALPVTVHVRESFKKVSCTHLLTRSLVLAFPRRPNCVLVRLMRARGLKKEIDNPMQIPSA
jgi:hypothetical protein